MRGSPDPARRLTLAVRGSPDPARRLTSRCARVSRPRTTSDLAVRGSPDPARRLTEGLAVRGSPDPARRLTEGLPGQRLALIQGDLRSNPRRGRETRASASLKGIALRIPQDDRCALEVTTFGILGIQARCPIRPRQNNSISHLRYQEARIMSAAAICDSTSGALLAAPS